MSALLERIAAAQERQADAIEKLVAHLKTETKPTTKMPRSDVIMAMAQQQPTSIAELARLTGWNKSTITQWDEVRSWFRLPATAQSSGS